MHMVVASVMNTRRRLNALLIYVPQVQHDHPLFVSRTRGKLQHLIR